MSDMKEINGKITAWFPIWLQSLLLFSSILGAYFDLKGDVRSLTEAAEARSDLNRELIAVLDKRLTFVENEQRLRTEIQSRRVPIFDLMVDEVKDHGKRLNAIEQRLSGDRR